MTRTPSPTSAPAPPEVGDRRTPTRCSRRAFVATGAVATVASLAGCSTLTDLVGDAVLQDVIVLNGTEESISGAVEVVDPDGDTVLESTFDLAASAGDERDIAEDLDSQTQFDDVWTDDGEYEASVELEEDLQGTENGADTVTIADPDGEHLVVGIGDAELAGVIGFRVFEGIDEVRDALE